MRIPAKLVGEELTMQLFEVYPELTSYLKKVIDVQYLEVSDWIA